MHMCRCESFIGMLIFLSIKIIRYTKMLQWSIICDGKDLIQPPPLKGRESHCVKLAAFSSI